MNVLNLYNRPPVGFKVAPGRLNPRVRKGLITDDAVAILTESSAPGAKPRSQGGPRR